AGPRVGEPVGRPGEVVLDVALAAHERAHLLPRRVAVHVVAAHALALAQRADPLDEARPRDAQRHGRRLVAVDARDGVLHVLAGLRVGHRVHALEAGDEVAAAHAAVGLVDGRVA